MAELGFGHSFVIPHSDFVIINDVIITSIYPHKMPKNQIKADRGILYVLQTI